MSLLVGCPVILPPREDVIASWTYRPHLLIVNGSHDDWFPLARPDTANLLALSWDLPEKNGGVAKSWNVIFHAASQMDCSHVALISQGLVLEGGTARLAELVDEYADWRGLITDFAWHCIVLSVKLWKMLGPFDEQFWPGYCVAPETPVLTRDLRWVPAGDLIIGSELVGVDEHPTVARGSRRYRPSVVTATTRRLAPCVRITMSDGREVVCSLDHKWLTKYAAPTNMPYKWRPASWLKPGYRIYAPLRTWGTDSTYEAGWLAGIFDGEGTLNVGVNKRVVSFSQKEGAVLDRAMGILASMGIPFTYCLRPSNGVADVEIGTRAYMLETLGRLRPVRLLRAEAWEGANIRSKHYENDLEVETVEQVGPTEVVTLETSSSTFLANGMVSHNCEDNDYVRRLELAGLHTASNPIPKVGREILPGSETFGATLTSGVIDPSCYGMNLDRYAVKWGGPPGAETFTIPYDGNPQPRKDTHAP